MSENNAMLLSLVIFVFFVAYSWLISSKFQVECDVACVSDRIHYCIAILKHVHSIDELKLRHVFSKCDFGNVSTHFLNSQLYTGSNCPCNQVLCECTKCDDILSISNSILVWHSCNKVIMYLTMLWSCLNFIWYTDLWNHQESPLVFFSSNCLNK